MRGERSKLIHCQRRRALNKTAALYRLPIQLVLPPICTLINNITVCLLLLVCLFVRKRPGSEQPRILDLKFGADKCEQSFKAPRLLSALIQYLSEQV